MFPEIDRTAWLHAGGSARLANHLISASPTAKNVRLAFAGKSPSLLRASCPTEGRFAIVTRVGCGMRWTRRLQETNDADADGEVVWSRRPDAGVKLVMMRAALHE